MKMDTPMSLTPSPTFQIKKPGIPFKCCGRGGFVMPSILSLPLTLDDFTSFTPSPKPVGRGRGRAKMTVLQQAPSPRPSSVGTTTTTTDEASLDERHSSSSMALSEESYPNSPVEINNAYLAVDAVLLANSVAALTTESEGALNAESEVQDSRPIDVETDKMASSEADVAKSEDTKSEDTLVKSEEQGSEKGASGVSDCVEDKDIYMSSEVCGESTDEALKTTKRSKITDSTTASDSESTDTVSPYTRNKDKSESLATLKTFHQPSRQQPVKNVPQASRQPQKAKPVLLPQPRATKNQSGKLPKKRSSRRVKKEPALSGPSDFSAKALTDWPGPLKNKEDFVKSDTNFPPLEKDVEVPTTSGANALGGITDLKGLGQILRCKPTELVSSRPASSMSTSMASDESVETDIQDIVNNLKCEDDNDSASFEISNIPEGIDDRQLKEFCEVYSSVDCVYRVSPQKAIVKMMGKGIEVAWIINALDGTHIPGFENSPELKLRKVSI